VNTFDVVIVGAGPAGIFTALELSKTPGLRIAILDKGRDIDQRRCPIREGSPECRHCKPCAILDGWGGAGAFSDGKLTLSPAVGGHLAEILGEGQASAEIELLDKRASLAGLRFISVPIRHMGTERCVDVMRRMCDALLERGVEIHMRTPVKEVITENGKVVAVTTEAGDTLPAQAVVLAPGREGASWLENTARALHLSLARNPVDLGLRIEVPAAVLQPITDLVYESKFVYFSKAFDDKIRTFCMCPYGEVSTEFAGDVLTVNGHSFANHKTANTNFALLVSKSFTEPFDDPIAYGKSIARLANLLSGGIMVQRLGDLESGRRSTHERLSRSVVTPTLPSAIPGDLNLVLPYRYVANILEMLHAMDEVAPGVASRHTLLYGVEVKFYSNRLKLTTGLETEVENLFACGDGAGVTRGLIQASAAGLVAARAIQERLAR